MAQLDNFRREAFVAAQYFYSDMAVQHAASKSRRLLNRLNASPSFWLAHSAAAQCAAYVALGRVFDTKSRFNLNALIDAFEAELGLFSRESLAQRKSEGFRGELSWLPAYLEKAHYPTTRDVHRLRKKVEDYRAIYDRAVKPARHKYLAHREKTEHVAVQALYGGGKVRELWRLVTFLHALHEALWDQLHNGRKPVLRSVRYSVKRIYDSDQHRSSPHERIISETKKLMTFIETATPNNALERTVKKSGSSKRRRAAAQLGR